MNTRNTRKSARCIALFYGVCTYGGSKEYALSEHNQAFVRYYAWNGYGMAWGKWLRAADMDAKCVEAFNNDSHFVLDGTFTEVCSGGKLSGSRIRLPLPA